MASARIASPLLAINIKKLSDFATLREILLIASPLRAINF